MTTQSDIWPRTSRWRRSVLVAAVALCAGLLAPLAAAPPARAAVSFDQKMLELVNQHRAAAGLRPVQPSLVLNTIAGPGPYLGCGAPLGGRATDMGARNYFSHTILNCGAQSVFNILSSTVGLVYSAAGENIAWMNGTTDPLVAAERLVNDLMNSPDHRANILDPRFTHVGIGSWNSAAGQTWSGAGPALTRVWIAAQVFAQMPLAAAPAVSLTPASIGFGERAVGATGPGQIVTVQNSGSAALSISSVSVAGTNPSDFAISSNSCGGSVAAGASCFIGISFTPTTAGSRSATLTLSGNAAGSPHSVALAGTGIAPLTAAVTNLVATGGDGQLTLTWARPTSGPAPTGFGIFLYDTGGYAGRYAWACADCTTTVFTGLPNGKQHYAAVHGFNGTAWGAGALSNLATPLAVPGAAANAQGVPGNGSLTMTWRPTTTPDSGVDGYGVFVYDANGFTGQYTYVCATCTSGTVTGLKNGSSYYGIVFPHNPNGWGGMAASAWTVVGTPGLAGNVTAARGNGSVRVSWTPAPAGGAPIIGYGAFAYDSAGNTGKFAWVCGTCTTASIEGLPAGKEYTVLVYGYNSFGWGVPSYSNRVWL